MAARRPTRWDVARELHLWHWKIGCAGLSLLALGWLIARISGRVGGWTMAIGVAAFLASVAWWAWDRLYRPLSSGQKFVRNKYHANRNEGGASVWDLGQHASAWAMRRKAAVVRPSLAVLTWWQLRQINPARYSVLVARTGYSVGPWSGQIGMHSSVEDVTAAVGGPRRGKSQLMACHILDAPGPVLCTSTRADLLEVTGPERRSVGKVDIFNPTGLGDIPSTIKWTPLAGCDDYATAQRRADSMIEARTGDAAMWAAQAQRILAVLLHAAARKGHRLQKVADWTADPTGTTRDEIIECLRGAPNALALVAEIRQFASTADRTRTSITTSIAPALQWLANPHCSLIGDAPLGEADLFDLSRFIESGHDTVYLIGSPDSKAVSPLISALTSEVAHQLRMCAGRKPSGRLDPPPALVLDEITMACPQAPMEMWTSDMGGRGVTIHLAFQSFAQLRMTWGQDAGDAILGNVGTLMVFGGLKAAADLATISNLTGQRLEQVDDDDRRYTVVMDGSDISELPTGEVLVFSPGIRPVLGHAPQAWQRKQPREAKPRPQRVRIAARSWMGVRSWAVRNGWAR